MQKLKQKLFEGEIAEMLCEGVAVCYMFAVVAYSCWSLGSANLAVLV